MVANSAFYVFSFLTSHRPKLLELKRGPFVSNGLVRGFIWDNDLPLTGSRNTKVKWLPPVRVVARPT